MCVNNLNNLFEYESSLVPLSPDDQTIKAFMGFTNALINYQTQGRWGMHYRQRGQKLKVKKKTFLDTESVKCFFYFTVAVESFSRC